MFKRLHGRSQFPGTGIGLALCHKIGAGFGGRIWVESELGHGRVFRFTVPDRIVPDVVATPAGAVNAVVREEVEDALLRSQQALSEAQRTAHLGSWELDLTSNEMVWSDELCCLYGYPPGSGPDMDDLLDRVHPDDRERLGDLIVGDPGPRSSFDVQHRVVLPQGMPRWLRSQGRVELDGNGVAVRHLGTSQDITQQKVAEEALVHQALHDPLTGLPNRVLLVDRLTQALARLGRSQTALGLLFVDVDRFKVVNDSLGHPIGDQVLLALADRLRGVLRAGDTLARFGGDEFVILCEGLHGEVEALGMAQWISEALVQPLRFGASELVVTVSTGIAIASSPLISAESLLQDADAAMYRAKEDGRARPAVFASSMRAKAVGRLNTEVSLRRAIAEHELELHYQPIVDLLTGRVGGVEALVRWRHPDRGLIFPDQFIPIAEETGLVVPLGAWVLREAAGQAQAWQRRPGCGEMTMSVNLSGCQIAQPDLTEFVGAVLGESGLAAHSLHLEITESVLMKDARRAVTILEALTALGVRLSVDDFGTGYSSLSYLRRFPVEMLKIDRSFVDGLGVDQEGSAIVRAITSLAEALSLTVVAEGVETALQRKSLLGLGCRHAQGFYFSPAVPATAIEVMLDRQSTVAG